jgi:hypothetical protein
VRFFIRSYTRRGLPNNKNETHRRRIEKAAEDAAHGVDREVNTLGKAAENGVSDFANNMMKKANGNQSTPKSTDKRRVSTTIERIANTFEKGEEEGNETRVEKRKSSGSLRSGEVRKKASAEHNNLRKKFEQGGQTSGFGQSVVSNPPLGEVGKKAKAGMVESLEKLQPYAEDMVGELERRAEETVRVIREAVGGESARSGEDFGEAARDVEERKGATDMADDITKDNMAESDGDSFDARNSSGRQGIKSTNENSKTWDAASISSVTSDLSSNFAGESERVGRSSTPSLPNERQDSPPKKSKIPKLSSSKTGKTSNRSPTRKILTPPSTTTSTTLSGSNPSSAAHSFGIVENPKNQ